MKPLTLLVLAGLVHIFSLNCDPQKSALTDTPDNTSCNLRDDHDPQLLRQLIGQTVLLSSATLEEECRTQGKSYKEFFELYPPGGILIDHEKIWEKDSLRQLVVAYRQAVPYPLLICADLSRGAGSLVKGYTRFPGLTGIAATQSPKLAYGAAKVMAWEAKSVGIDWVLNPHVNVIRPFAPGGPNGFTDGLSDDPLFTQWFLKEMIDGYQHHHILATAKTSVYLPQTDDHINAKKRSPLFDWQADQDMILNTLIKSGVSAIMMVPFADENNIITSESPSDADSGCLTSLASKRIVSRLKKERGFKSVIVRGALANSMDSTECKGQIDIEWIKNGTDMLLCPSLDYYDAMEHALKNGTIKEGRFNDALERISCLKKKINLERKYAVLPELSREQRIFSQTLAKEILLKSLTLIKNTPQLIPLSSRNVESILLITNAGHDHGDLISKLEKQIEKKQPVYSHDELTLTELFHVAESVDLILYALFSGNEMSKDSASLWINKIFQANPGKSIVISFDDPFHYHQFQNAAVYINTFNTDPCVAKPLVDALYGKLSFQGHSPVNLEKKIRK
ncbi:hypothetical protein GF406_21765 [candidate division KSB1 bacterium]|nr:hypothetical protein [candidate division KSB1 bacterium]